MPQPSVFTLFNDQNFVFDKPVDLTDCDREPIHVPGLIQPHGILLVLNASQQVIQLSTNSATFLGLSAMPQLPASLAGIIGNTAAKEVQEHITTLSFQQNFRVSIAGQKELCEAILHQNEECVVLEVEQCTQQQREITLKQYSELLQQLQHTPDVQQLCQQAAQAVKELTGFDRVMVYKFHEDRSGEVVGEAKEAALEPFMGLHFPATDIPKQAHLLYLHNPTRLIPDVAYTPVVLEPRINPATGKPLNLSLSTLRSVSPIHIQYLKNMGVKASMSISILLNGALWGLFTCHHTSAYQLPYAHREACYMLGRSFSSILNDKLRSEDEVYQRYLHKVQTRLLARMSQAENYTRSLYDQEPTIKELLKCSGCAIVFGEEYYTIGETPTQEQVLQLAAWMQKEVPQDVYETNALATTYPAAAAFKAVGSGLLAITVSRIQQEYIFWFRKEVLQTITWAGRPEKAVQYRPEEQPTLVPRASFAAWTEQVAGTAAPWSPLEVQAAREMRGMLVDVVMRVAGELKLRADILSRLNRELERSNSELDSFAYIAAHDLKEPLRGIRNYSQFLLGDYHDSLDKAGQDKLHTLMRLSIRMEQLLDSLLHYSQVGRMDIKKTTVDLNKVIREVQDSLRERLENTTVSLQVADSFPSLIGNEVQLQELFQNLIVNAIKYNKSDEKVVTIGWSEEKREGAVRKVFFVRDNGIGIEKRHYEAIFSIFRRLHHRHAYGGGTGVGLTIVKKVIERHGGSIWLHSVPGEGTTFYFTLAQEESEYFSAHY